MSCADTSILLLGGLAMLLVLLFAERRIARSQREAAAQQDAAARLRRERDAIDAETRRRTAEIEATFRSRADPSLTELRDYTQHTRDKWPQD